MEKIKSFILKYKRQILYFAVLIGIVVLVSFLSLLVMRLTGILYTDEGGNLSFHVEMFESFKSSWYGWIAFCALQTIFSVLLCVVPGASMAFIILSQSLYTVPWQAFLLSFASVMISSFGMYLVGRFGGYKMCVAFLGEEDCEKSLGLLRDKGTVFFPLMMMFPVFPDDALVMVAGTTRMSLAWFIPSIVVGRGIGIATIIFGLAIVPFDQFTTPIHWIVFIILVLAFIIAVFAAAIRFNKYLEARRQRLSGSSENGTPDTDSAPDTDSTEAPSAPSNPEGDAPGADGEPLSEGEGEKEPLPLS